MADEQDEGIPESVQTSLFHFHDTITRVEDELTPYFSKSLDEIETEMEPLQKAKLELMTIFAANSLHWMYLCTKGENPVNHPILDELSRIKSHMDRLKQLEDRVKAPKLDKRAAKSFVRNALWEPTNNNNNDEGGEVQKDVDSTNESTADPIEQQLDEVLKRCKAAAVHKRFTNSDDEKDNDNDEDEAKEIPVEPDSTTSTTKSKRVKATSSTDMKKKKKKKKKTNDDEVICID